MAAFTLHQAKNRVPELIRRAEAGGEIIAARGDVPILALRQLDRDQVSAKRLTEVTAGAAIAGLGARVLP